MNCWEFQGCGVEEDCAAFYSKGADRFLGGFNGGRACMFILGTKCFGSSQMTWDEKTQTCSNCEFYKWLQNKFPEELNYENYKKFLMSKIFQVLPIDDSDRNDENNEDLEKK